MQEHTDELIDFIKGTFYNSEYDSVPLIQEVIDLAAHFTKLLPEEVAIPCIDLEADGDVCCEWFHSKGKVLDVRISSESLIWAHLPSNTYGVYKFDSNMDKIPQEILDLIALVDAADFCEE